MSEKKPTKEPETETASLVETIVMCRYDLAWRGQCKNEATHGEYCEEHAEEVCVSCGDKATHQCHETSFFVCGAPLCDNCEHTICENGCNSGAPTPDGLNEHCRKDEQVWKPWYA